MPDRKQAALAIESFLRAIGRDEEKEPELKGTGERVANAFLDELCGGYAVDVSALLSSHRIAATRTEPNESAAVLVRDVTISTTCPHHLMPAVGTATVAFEPNDAVVGLGAVVETLHAFAHRLTLQEAIAENVTRALFDSLAPKWVAVRLVLSHGCMTARGERKHGALVEVVRIKGDRSDLLEIHRLLGVTA